MKLISRLKVSSLKQPVSVRFGVRTFQLNPEPKFPDFRYRVAVPEISGHWIASNAAIMYGYAVNTLENRLKAHVCELCGATDSEFYEIHHVNKLKNLKGKEHWERVMIAKKRRTLVVCRHCHKSVIHKN